MSRRQPQDAENHPGVLDQPGGQSQAKRQLAPRTRDRLWLSGLAVGSFCPQPKRERQNNDCQSATSGNRMALDGCDFPSLAGAPPSLSVSPGISAVLVG